MAVVVTPASTIGFQGIHPLSPDGLWAGERASLGCKTFYPLVYYMDTLAMLVVFAILASLALLRPFP